MVDSNTRLISMGYNKLVESYKEGRRALMEKLRFIIKSLNDKEAKSILLSYNSLKERQQLLNGVGVGNAGMIKIQLIKRLTNKGYDLQVMGVNALREFLKSERINEEKERLQRERLLKEQGKICKRFLNQELNLQAGAYRLLILHCKDIIERERILMMKQRGICRKIIDANTRFMGMAMNSLKHFYAQSLLEDETHRNIDSMRNSIIDNIFKGREKYEKKTMKIVLDRLYKWNQLCNTQQAIVKNMFRKILGKNDAVLMYAYKNLTENYIQRRTFGKCKSLFKSLEISDRCIDSTYRIYYRLLVTFKHVNPWLLRTLTSLTKNVKVDPQIAFWRLKDMRTKGTALNAGRIVRLRKMFEIINKHYVMQIARSFWKIDRCLDLDQTMNSSFYYQQKLMMQNQGSDMISNSNNYTSKNDLKSTGELKVHYMDDLNFKSPDREEQKYRATSPRQKYQSQNVKPPVPKKTGGVMKKR